MNNLDLSTLISAPTQPDTAIALLEYWIVSHTYPRPTYFQGIEAAIAIVEGLSQQELAEFTDYHPLDLVWEGKEVLRIAKERFEGESVEPSVAIANKNYNSISDEEFKSYLDAVLFTETDEDDDILNDHYDVDDFSAEDSLEQRKECENFIAENREAIDLLLESGEYEIGTILHDFWFTRNHQGSGFWDGRYSEPQASQLTASAHRYGQKWVYIGDDGVIYFS